MTDNEITKAMEDYRNSKIIQSDNGVISIGDILDLIKRKDQQIEALTTDKETLQKHIAEKEAEIERLEKRLKAVQDAKCVYSYDGETIEYCVHSPCPISKTADQIIVKAVEEFAEKLKPLVDDGYVVDIIDSLVKEWREKSNGDINTES